MGHEFLQSNLILVLRFNQYAAKWADQAPPVEYIKSILFFLITFNP